MKAYTIVEECWWDSHEFADGEVSYTKMPFYKVFRADGTEVFGNGTPLSIADAYCIIVEDLDDVRVEIKEAEDDVQA